MPRSRRCATLPPPPALIVSPSLPFADRLCPSAHLRSPSPTVFALRSPSPTLDAPLCPSRQVSMMETFWLAKMKRQEEEKQKEQKEKFQREVDNLGATAQTYKV